MGPHRSDRGERERIRRGVYCERQRARNREQRTARRRPDDPDDRDPALLHRDGGRERAGGTTERRTPPRHAEKNASPAPSTNASSGIGQNAGFRQTP